MASGHSIYQYAPNPISYVDPYGFSCKEIKPYADPSIPKNGIVTFPGAPWEGVAHQEYSPKAIAARKEVASGTTLYRIGKMGKSDTAEAQFWAIEHPSSSGYAARYGIPKANVEAADFYETAVLKPGSSFVTRSAPADPDGINPGGAIEVVVNSNDVQMLSFSAGAKTPYTGN